MQKCNTCTNKHNICTSCQAVYHVPDVFIFRKEQLVTFVYDKAELQCEYLRKDGMIELNESDLQRLGIKPRSPESQANALE
jgi:hypothetical protein